MRIDVYCYYSVNNGDVYDYGMIILGKVYRGRTLGKSLKDKARESVRQIKKIVGDNFELYCNETEGIRRHLEDENVFHLDGLYSKNSRYAKFLQMLVRKGVIEKKPNKAEVESKIRQSIINQHNRGVCATQLVKADMQYIEDKKEEVKEEIKVDSKVRSDKTESLLEEIKYKSNNRLDIYLRWSRGEVTEETIQTRCVYVTHDLKHQYVRDYIEELRRRGESRVISIRDVIEDIVKYLEGKSMHIVMYMDNKTVVSCLNGSISKTKFKKEYEELNKYIECMGAIGITFEFKEVSYHKSIFKYRNIANQLTDLVYKGL